MENVKLELQPCHRLTCVFVRLVSIIETALPGTGTHKHRIEQVTNLALRRSLQILVNVRNQLVYFPPEVATRSQWSDSILPEVLSTLHYVSKHMYNNPLIVTYADCILTCQRRHVNSRCTCGFSVVFDACAILAHYLLPSSNDMLFTEKVEAFTCNANVKNALRCIARIRTNAIHTKYFEVSDLQRMAFNGAITIIATEQNKLHLLRFHMHETSRLYPCSDIAEHADEVGDGVVEYSSPIFRTSASIQKYDLPVVMAVCELLASPADTSTEKIGNVFDDTMFTYHVQVAYNLLTSRWSFALYVLLVACMIGWCMKNCLLSCK
jgi:hypothetical protein